MAKIRPMSAEQVFPLKAWGGLNENPDGDTKLKMGEASVMKNWAITRDSNLRRRQGSRTISEFKSPVMGIWFGKIHSKAYFMAAAENGLYIVWNEDSGQIVNRRVGELDTSVRVHMFGFSEDLYILNGTEYYVFNGNTLSAVEGYIPLVLTAVVPDGGGETLEQVNRLSGKRRLWISPDGKGTVFRLPEKNVLSIDYVKDLLTNENLPKSGYTTDLAEGKVTFTEAPAQAVNSYEIGWTVENLLRCDVTSMRYSELYNGSQDTSVFLYGNGTNKTIYSGIDYDGNPRADYFPDLNDIAVGSANEPITALIRQYSTLMCFKTDSAWSITANPMTLADGSVINAFYVSPTNKIIGNAALGQTQLVLNAPRTLHGNDIFEWRNTSAYTSNLSKDERQAKRISDRITKTLSSFELKDCVCWDDNFAQEYYICYGDTCIVNNYAVDAWYVYKGWNVNCMCNAQDELLFGTTDGKIKHLSYKYNDDDGKAIDAYWESGSMSFGADYMRKYSATVWLGIKPEANGEVFVTIETDKKTRNTERVVLSNLSSFKQANFSNWSFLTNRKPKMHKLKLKAKKFVFYKLIFKSNSADSSATILSADIRVRSTGYTK